MREPAHLPRHYEEVIDILLRSLGPERASDELLGAGMAPFFYLPHTLFVAQQKTFRSPATLRSVASH